MLDSPCHSPGSQKSPNVREKPSERTEQCQTCETGSKIRGERTDRNKPFKKELRALEPNKVSSMARRELLGIASIAENQRQSRKRCQRKVQQLQKSQMGLAAARWGRLWEAGIEASPRAERSRDLRLMLPLEKLPRGDSSVAPLVTCLPGIHGVLGSLISTT